MPNTSIRQIIVTFFWGFAGSISDLLILSILHSMLAAFKLGIIYLTRNYGMRLILRLKLYSIGGCLISFI